MTVCHKGSMPKEERQYAKKGLCLRTICQEKKAFRQGTLTQSLLSDKNMEKFMKPEMKQNETFQ